MSANNHLDNWDGQKLPRRVFNKRPGFRSFSPSPLGKWLIKLSASEGVFCIVYWLNYDTETETFQGEGNPMLTLSYLQAICEYEDPRYTYYGKEFLPQVRFFSTEEASKVFINQLAEQ